MQSHMGSPRGPVEPNGAMRGVAMSKHCTPETEVNQEARGHVDSPQSASDASRRTPAPMASLLILRHILTVLLLLAGVACRPVPGAPASSSPHAIDFHMHLRSLDGAEIQRAQRAVVESKLDFGVVVSPGYHVAEGCSRFPCEAQQAWTEEKNDRLLDGVRPFRVLLPFCGIPLGYAWSVREVSRCVRLGARGIKLHPVAQKVSLENKDVKGSLEAVVSEAATLEIPILIHVESNKPSEVTALFEVAAREPRATVVVAHQLGASLPRMVHAPKHVLIDMSGLALAPAESGAFFVGLWREIGVDRVLFGSDWPIMSPSNNAAALERLGLRPEEKRLIFGENARRILGGKRKAADPKKE